VASVGYWLYKRPTNERWKWFWDNICSLPLFVGMFDVVYLINQYHKGFWLPAVSVGVFSVFYALCEDWFILKVICKGPHWLQYPFYRRYFYRILVKLQGTTASPLISFPMIMFVELRVPAIFKERGLSAVKDGIDAWARQVRPEVFKVDSSNGSATTEPPPTPAV